jgi:hypothetical protein
METSMNWGLVTSVLSAAFTGLTWLVYIKMEKHMRVSNKILAQTSEISLRMVEDSLKPILLAHFQASERRGDRLLQRWRLSNFGTGPALNITATLNNGTTGQLASTAVTLPYLSPAQYDDVEIFLLEPALTTDVFRATFLDVWQKQFRVEVTSNLVRLTACGPKLSDDVPEMLK